MERFYFCDFLGNVIERKCNKGVTSVRVSDNLSDRVQLAEAYISGSSLIFGCDGEVGDEKFDFLGSLNADDKRIKSTYEELKYSDENPIILVATKKFKVYHGVPTYIKYLPVKDGVLVALIKGYISVMSSDGDMISLSRNCDTVSSDMGHVFGADEINKLNSLSDRDSDVPYSDYVVSDCIICLDMVKGIKNLKFSKEFFTYLDKSIFEKAKIAKEERERKILEDKKRKSEENARFTESLRERERKEEAAKAAKKSSGKGTSKKKVKEDKGNVQTGFEGAKSFLAYVEGLKKGN